MSVNNFVESVHENSVNISTREIFLHGFYSEEDPGVDFRMCNTFLKNIRILHKTSKPIVIHQNTEGGCWHSGITIFDIIANSKCPIIFVMWGAAASMGSIIPQAADYRIIAENCYFLIHDGTEEISGTHKQVHQHMLYCRKAREKMLDIYVDACREGQYFKGLEDKKIRDYIKKQINNKEDWILSAEEAVNFGFADEILNLGTIDRVKKEYE